MARRVGLNARLGLMGAARRAQRGQEARQRAREERAAIAQENRALDDGGGGDDFMDDEPVAAPVGPNAGGIGPANRGEPNFIAGQIRGGAVRQDAVRRGLKYVKSKKLSPKVLRWAYRHRVKKRTSSATRARMQQMGRNYGRYTKRAWQIAKAAGRNHITSADMLAARGGKNQFIS